MNHEIITKNGKRLLSIVVVLMLMLQVYIPADAKATSSSMTTYIEASSSSPQRMNVEVQGSAIMVHLYDENITTEDWAFCSLVKMDENRKSYLKQESRLFTGHDCDLSLNLSGVEDGDYTFEILYYPYGTGTSAEYEEAMNVSYIPWAQYSVGLTISDGLISFYSVNGGGEQDFVSYANQHYNPNNYLTPVYSSTDVNAYVDIKATAQRITANCNTDEKKVRAIHDWICSNIAYDYEEYYSGRGIDKAAKAPYVYENRRGVCSGFSRLANVMLNTVGVPVMNVNGRVNYYGGEGVYDTNHEWNMVYYNGSWHIFDFTWDSANAYYGEGNSNNHIGIPSKYDYYDANPFIFGMNHMSESIVEGWNDNPSVANSITPRPNNETIIDTDSDPKIDTDSNPRIDSDEDVIQEDETDQEPNSEVVVDSNNVIVQDDGMGMAIVRDEVLGEQVRVSQFTILEGKVYRMYDPNRGEHFYTKDSGEAEVLMAQGWVHEYIEDFNAVSASEEGAVAVYRLYNPYYGGMHFYTESADEARFLKNIGWNYEGISHYVYDKKSSKGIDQIRLYNPNSSNGEHNWTADLYERAVLISAGWVDEGICWRIK